jgi:hypothetical protein
MCWKLPRYYYYYYYYNIIMLSSLPIFQCTSLAPQFSILVASSSNRLSCVGNLHGQLATAHIFSEFKNLKKIILDFVCWYASICTRATFLRVFFFKILNSRLCASTYILFTRAVRRGSNFYTLLQTKSNAIRMHLLVWPTILKFLLSNGCQVCHHIHWMRNLPSHICDWFYLFIYLFIYLHHGV